MERKWLVMVAMGAGTFMTALDGSVVNVILPVIARTFGSNVAFIEWVITVYLLVVSGLLLTFGRLGDVRGHKTIFCAGMVTFVVGSALCGAAPGAAALVAFRGLQAFGGAMMFANSPAILTKAFPPTQRGQALGLAAMMTYLGLTAGPSFGGWLADSLGWRAAFYINLPVGAVGLGLAMAFVDQDRAERAGERFDWQGALVFVGGLVSLLLALNRGHVWGWSSPRTLGLSVVSILLLLLFIKIEQKARSPMLDLSLFRNRLFAASTGSAILNYMCVNTITFLMPFYLIQGKGLTPGEAGRIMTAQPLVMAMVAPISGTLSDRLGSRLPASLGMGVLAIGLILLSRLGPGSSAMHVGLGLAIAGLGTGTFISPNSNALMGSAPRNRQGIAAAVLATARNTGMVLGVGLAGAVFTTALSRAGEAEFLAGLYAGVSWSLVTAVGIAVLGIVVSALRGTHADADPVSGG